MRVEGHLDVTDPWLKFLKKRVTLSACAYMLSCIFMTDRQHNPRVVDSHTCDLNRSGIKGYLGVIKGIDLFGQFFFFFEK